MFWDVLVKLCNERGTSPSAVANAIGLGNSAAVRWKKGSIPQDRTLTKLAEYFGVSVKTLTDTEIPLTKLSGNVNNVSDMLEALSQDTLRLIPVYESISAGFGALARDEVVSRVPCFIRSDTEAEETLGIVVHGDSMYPKIEDGDTIIVHKQTSVDSGTLAAVMVDGDEGYVKRVEYGADWIHLISINPMYPIMKFKGEDVLRVQVVGRVTRIIKDV